KKALFTQYGIAIIATNTWYAKKAIEKLQLKTADEHNGSFNSAQIAEQMAAALEVGPTIITEEVGEVDPIFADHTDLMEATYKAPFLAHAPMETVSCTALVTRDGVDIWVGHQSISGVQSAASHITGIAKENIRIHTTFLGGGFGRKGELAIVLRACTVAKAFPGIPVMTLYTREEDMQCSIYRPGSVSKFKAAIGSGGEILAWENHVVAQAPMIGGMSRAVPPMDPMPGMENGVGDGAHFLPYYMAHRKVGLTIPDLPIEVGLLRSVCNGLNAYFTECFLDECAHKAHQDPLQFRRQKLKKKPKELAVLDKLAEISQWNRPLAPNRYRGMAIHNSFGSIVGQVAEITQTAQKEFSIDQFYCVIDCGTAIHPDTVKGQMEGSIIFGLSSALYGEITWEDGIVVQQNFP
ncbi:MAG: molybdopterin cofactor-binding domain-containing protein, partial [Bacteroidota bacterium]